MKEVRDPTTQELAVILALLQGKPESARYIESVLNLAVAEMNDGGMGSLLLFPKGSKLTVRSFGKQIVLGEFRDEDGVSVSATLNVDKDDTLFELDLWKVDFSSLLRLPDPADIRVIG